MSDEPLPDLDLILYLAQDDRTRLQVRLEGDSVWLLLNQIANLFQRDKSVISRHIKNVFKEGELSAEAAVAKSSKVQTKDGKQYSNAPTLTRPFPQGEEVRGAIRRLNPSISEDERATGKRYLPIRFERTMNR
jgi:hypothetical protein